MFYTPTHEWISIQGDIGTIGITLYAKQELGEVVFIELPKVGTTIALGQEFAVIESTKAAADIYSPVTGEVVEINSALAQGCDPINHSPEGNGWLCKMRIHNLKEVDALLDLAQYQAMTGCSDRDTEKK